jgi:uncharacterized delta-60 repeat protein
MGLIKGDLALSRWLPDGTIDAAFGEGGVALTAPEFARNMQDMVVQSDGRIVVAGDPFRAVRFLADGSLDFSFGTGGMAVLDPPPDTGGFASAVAVMSDGKILLGGGIRNSQSSGTFKPRLCRMLPDGSVDPSFGAAGGITLPVEAAVIWDIAMQPDGKIVMSGIFSTGASVSPWLARCDASGALDPSFGNGGSAIAPHLPVGEAHETYALALQTDGKMVIAGLAGATDSGIFVARYSQDGSPDVTFGDDGGLMTNITSGSDYALALSVQRDGKLVVAGTSNDRFVLARYLPDGDLDDNFGIGGIMIPAVTTGPSHGSAVALQPDGRIVMGGTTFDPPSPLLERLVVVRCVDRDIPDTLAGESPAGTVLANGGTVQLGPVLRGDPTKPEATITLRNTGSTPLTNLAATLTGPGANRFTILSTLPAVLDSGVTATVTVRFLPSFEISSFTAALVVESVDHDMPVFVAVLQGATVLPAAALTLLEGSQTIGENATVDFGSTIASRPVTRVFTIKNTGNIGLQVQGLSLGAAGTPDDFAVGPPETDALPAGASTTFPVTFTPSGSGERTARLRIASTDTLGLPLEITLLGRLAEGLGGWRLTHFGSLLNEGPGANLSDPDNDGVVNLMEYATFTDPAVPNTPPGQLTLTGVSMEYRFTRPSSAENFVRYDLEWAGALEGPWTTISTSPAVLGDDGIKQQVKFSLAAGNNGRRFIRLRVGRK